MLVAAEKKQSQWSRKPSDVGSQLPNGFHRSRSRAVALMRGRGPVRNVVARSRRHVCLVLGPT
jgi:hypothetical protein